MSRTAAVLTVFGAALLHGSVSMAEEAVHSVVLQNQVREAAASPVNQDILATIIQSGSTNTRGYSISLQDDGSATVEWGGISAGADAPEYFPPGTVDTKKLKILLIQVGDVSRIPVGFCAKSASFGTTTRIIYAGKTSGDLQCPILSKTQESEPVHAQEASDLRAEVHSIQSQLHINVMRGRMLRSFPN